MSAKRSLQISVRSGICTHLCLQHRYDGTFLSSSFFSAVATADILSNDEDSSQSFSDISSIMLDSKASSSADIKADTSKSAVSAKSKRIVTAAAKSTQKASNIRADVSKLKRTALDDRKQLGTSNSPIIMGDIKTHLDVQKCIAHGWKMGNALLVISAYEQSRSVNVLHLDPQEILCLLIQIPF